MKQVSVAEAKARLSSIVREVEAGEEIALTRHGKVVIRLVPDKPMTAADFFRELAKGGGIDFEAPEDLPAEDVPSWDD